MQSLILLEKSKFLYSHAFPPFQSIETRHILSSRSFDSSHGCGNSFALLDTTSVANSMIMRETSGLIHSLIFLLSQFMSSTKFHETDVQATNVITETNSVFISGLFKSEDIDHSSPWFSSNVLRDSISFEYTSTVVDSQTFLLSEMELKPTWLFAIVSTVNGFHPQLPFTFSALVAHDQADREVKPTVQVSVVLIAVVLATLACIGLIALCLIYIRRRRAAKDGSGNVMTYETDANKQEILNDDSQIMDGWDFDDFGQTITQTFENPQSVVGMNIV
jgi:hypothetical protein